VAVLELIMKHFNIPAKEYSCTLHAQSKSMFELQSNYTIYCTILLSSGTATARIIFGHFETTGYHYGLNLTETS
jgi:hypothetical protein